MDDERFIKVTSKTTRKEICLGYGSLRPRTSDVAVFFAYQPVANTNERYIIKALMGFRFEYANLSTIQSLLKKFYDEITTFL